MTIGCGLAVALHGGQPAVMVSCGVSHTVVLTEAGCVWTSGNGQYGKLGHGNDEPQLTLNFPQILSAPLLAFLKKGGIVKAVSPWYCVAWNTLFIVRSNFQEKDLCCLSLSSLSCRVSSFCRLDPRELGSSFVRVCFKRCHCAPSMLRGPDGKYTVTIPCVVTA